MIRIALILAALAVSTPALAIGATCVPAGCKVSPWLWGLMSRIDCSERPLPSTCRRVPYRDGLDKWFGTYVDCSVPPGGYR